MRVLVACEFSGVVRDAFLDTGHFAVSCDILPTERWAHGKASMHYQGDVRDILPGLIVGTDPHSADGWLREPWDLLIAHPPCTYLANSGVRWLYGGKGTERDPERWALMEEAAAFFRELLDAPIPRIAVENPIMHRHAGLPKPTQIVQPWWFGHGETKATGLWLKNLPPLEPTNIVPERVQRVHLMGPSPDRWRERSRTYEGLAAAMAAQWGVADMTLGLSA